MNTVLLPDTTQNKTIISDALRTVRFFARISTNTQNNKESRKAKGLIFVIALLAANLFFAQKTFGQSQTYSTAGTFTFTVPDNVTSITVSAWGGGGCSGQNTSGQARGGGGGGAFTRGTINVTSGSQLTVVVGAGGLYSDNSTTTDDGLASSIGAIVANGGLRGIIGDNSITNNGGAGGTASTIPGGVSSFISFAGGKGGNGYVAAAAGGGGGGGESASSTGIGNPGSNGTAGGVGGAGGAGNSTGGDGGRGADDDGNPTSSNGVSPGGGGGGRADNGGNNTNGSAGQVVLTWTVCTPPAAPGVTNPVNYCLNDAAIPLTATGSNLLWYSTSTGGTGSSAAPIPVTTPLGTTSYYVSQTVGCEGARARIDVIVHSSPSASVINQSDVTCFSGNDGSITISASGGTSPYSYSVNGGGSFTPSAGNPYVFGGLVANQAYRIKVKDNNGCVSK